MHDGDVCNLGAVNLEKFVNDQHELDLSELMRVVDLMVRMLDAVIDISHFSSEFVNKTSRDNRRIGLGFMGLGDALAAMRVPYNSEEGRRMTQAICDAIQSQAHTTSAELAELKGCFPNFEMSVYHEGKQSVAARIPEGMPVGTKRRNAALTNVAPTGTISLMFGTTNGIEPQYSTAFFYKGVLDQKTAIQCGWSELFKALHEEFFPSLYPSPSPTEALWEHLRCLWRNIDNIFDQNHTSRVRADFIKSMSQFVMWIVSTATTKSYNATPKHIHLVFCSAMISKHLKADLNLVTYDCVLNLQNLIENLSIEEVRTFNGNVPEIVLDICQKFQQEIVRLVRQACDAEFESLIKRISTEGTLQHMNELPDHIRDVFVVAGDISPKDHILMQAVAQAVFCNAVSKTINMPNNATLAEVFSAYILAFMSGLKGCTVYRDGSRVFQPLNSGIEEKDEDEDEDNPAEYVNTEASSSFSSTPNSNSSTSDEENDFISASSSSNHDLRRAGFSECPECKEIALKHEGGCDACSSCSYSACSTPLRRSISGNSS